jgi:hypothetical protein
MVRQWSGRPALSKGPVSKRSVVNFRARIGCITLNPFLGMRENLASSRTAAHAALRSGCRFS